MSKAPRIVAIGGTIRPGSSTELALAAAAAAARDEGAEVSTFDGAYMAALPHYRGPHWSASDGAELIAAIRDADGVLLASPGYHGTVSGLVKNAIDYLEELAADRRPYLHGRPVGLIVTAFGHQAANSGMTTLRTIAHALRGWPTPFGAALKVGPDTFTAGGGCLDPAVLDQLDLVGRQVARVAGRL
ncbi:NADPH-dependent oxidoreductase [Sphingomonas ginkgonis]|uniref:NADPH-dependent oxidoreductase n=1 Tax=Sphingomonas ginkgonis TaxID=2315330 RepID=A0A429V7L9_9SPHN|nr:NAD(P)H-dependent oxidoreductase [Sphingomonas ginkgonis]RST29909.1 NADPH-dependent oxidoreductase [Sphingomonas ginkgonis]